MLLQTSVLEACFRRLRRKFHILCFFRLPSRKPLFSVLDGSFIPCVSSDFRPEGLFSVFRTEVCPPVLLQTSVLEACFRRLGRKFHILCFFRLPSRKPLFSVLDGSFIPCVSSDFRPEGLFSVFRTEVCPPVLLQTSVLEACFRRLGRKFTFLCPC